MFQRCVETTLDIWMSLFSDPWVARIPNPTNSAKFGRLGLSAIAVAQPLVFICEAHISLVIFREWKPL